jgi:transposase
VGPVIAAAVIGDGREVPRFPGRDHFAAYNGTAPIEVSSGKRTVHRLSRRGSRRLNHAIHMAAVTQIRNPRSEGRVYFGKKLAEGKTRKEALRSLKRHVSDAVFACLQADAAQARGPGGQSGNDSAASAASSHPERQLFGQATPGPATQPYDPKAESPDPSLPAPLPPPRERPAGSRTGRSPAAQRRPQAFLTRPPASRQ